MSLKYQSSPQIFYTQIPKLDNTPLQMIMSETLVFWSSTLAQYILIPTSTSYTSKYVLLLALYLIQLDEVGRRVCSCLPVPLCHNQTEAARTKIVLTCVNLQRLCKQNTVAILSNKTNSKTKAIENFPQPNSLPQNPLSSHTRGTNIIRT